MLSPDAPHMPLLLSAVLALLLAGLTVRAVIRDRRDYGRFKRMHSTVKRQAVYRRWLIDSFVVFGGASVALLLLVWQFVPPFLAQVSQWPPMEGLRTLMEAGGTLATVIVWALAAALIFGTVGAVWLARASTDVPTVGDISALLPRNRAELRWGAALSINAGIVEELLFRLALPALLFGITGNALVAVIASLVVFALLHLYQGVWGIVGTLFIGALLMALFLATGSIVVAIVAHALFDLRSLVLIPVVVFEAHLPVQQRRAAVERRAAREAAAVEAVAAREAAADASAADAAVAADVADVADADQLSAPDAPEPPAARTPMAEESAARSTDSAL